MPAPKPVKRWPTKPLLVGVIANVRDLHIANQVSPLPDLFEVRLDCLAAITDLEQKVRRLAAPVIVTARHPAEGGRNNLPGPVRRDLLLKYLSLARYVDVELRSARICRPVLDSARHLGVKTIISFHDLENTPRLGSLRAKARHASGLGGAVFKVATKTDTPHQLGRLMQFISVNRPGIPLSVMGIGRLGTISRLLLVQCGSIMAYASLREPQIEGQLSLKAFRAALKQIKLPA